MDDLVLRIWYLARCVDCPFTLPFDTEVGRDEWAAGHREIGHQVRVGYERRWRQPVIIAGHVVPDDAGPAVSEAVQSPPPPSPP